MAHDRHSSEPTAPAIPSSRTPRHDGWTAAKQVEFLRMLAATQNVGAAAQSVGMGRQSAYKLRARLDDQPFGAAWRLAVRDARNVVLDAAIERAVNGVEVPHFWKGELIGTSKRFDERLTTALLKTGALQRAAAHLHGPEREFAERGLPRLLDRIASGPAKWRDIEDERDFAWGAAAR